jgi:hypothetical protein
MGSPSSAIHRNIGNIDEQSRGIPYLQNSVFHEILYYEHFSLTQLLTIWVSKRGLMLMILK